MWVALKKVHCEARGKHDLMYSQSQPSCLPNSHLTSSPGRQSIPGDWHKLGRRTVVSWRTIVSWTRVRAMAAGGVRRRRAAWLISNIEVNSAASCCILLKSWIVMYFRVASVATSNNSSTPITSLACMIAVVTNSQVVMENAPITGIRISKGPRLQPSPTEEIQRRVPMAPENREERKQKRATTPMSSECEAGAFRLA